MHGVCIEVAHTASPSLVAEIAPWQAMRRRLLVDNPIELFGFDKYIEDGGIAEAPGEY